MAPCLSNMPTQYISTDTSFCSRSQDGADLSPRARIPGRDGSSSSRNDIAPWDQETDPLDRRKTSVMKPSFQIAPWDNRPVSPGALSPSGSFRGYLFDSHTDRSPRSPSFPTQLGRQDTWHMGFDNDDRRPSVASTTTMSSTGSGRNYGRGLQHSQHKKLNGFFGEELPGSDESRGYSEVPMFGSMGSGAEATPRPRFSRNGSFINGYENQHSGGARTPEGHRSSRPKTPQPSSDVTPWLFQDREVSRCKSRHGREGRGCWQTSMVYPSTLSRTCPLRHAPACTC